MVTIILEGVLFVAFAAAVAALLSSLVSETPFGVWLRQGRNRRRIERDAALRCSVHGMHEERELVRLPNGERICPDCFREIANG
jgi:hypothetical protein